MMEGLEVLLCFVFFLLKIDKYHCLGFQETTGVLARMIVEAQLCSFCRLVAQVATSYKNVKG